MPISLTNVLNWRESLPHEPPTLFQTPPPHNNRGMDAPHFLPNMTTITGNTFPVKEELKKLGGKWNPTAKGWDVPDNKADAARAIVAAANPTKSFPVRSRGDNYGRCNGCGRNTYLYDGDCDRCRRESGEDY